MSVHSQSLVTSIESSSYPSTSKHVFSDEISTFKNEVNRFIQKIDELIEKGKNTLEEGNEILAPLENDLPIRLEALEVENFEKKHEAEISDEQTRASRASEEDNDTDASSLRRHSIPTFDEPPTEQIIRHATDLLKLQKISSLMDELIAKTQECFGRLPRKKEELGCPTPIMEEGDQYKSFPGPSDEGESQETRSNPGDGRPKHGGTHCRRRASWERLDEFLLEPLDGTLCDPLPEVDPTYLHMPCNCKRCEEKHRPKPVAINSRFDDAPPEGEENEKKNLSKDEVLLMPETCGHQK